MQRLVCEECGATDEGGVMEYGDGKLYHFRNIPKDGHAYPVLCCGKFVKKETVSGQEE